MTTMGLLYQLLFFLTPFLLSSQNSEQFELPKMYFIYGLTIVIFAVHLLNFIRGRVPLFRRTFLDIPLILFLSSQIVSTFFSIDIHTSFFGYYSRMNGGLLSLIVYCLLYWILAVYINENLKKKIIFTSLLSGFFIAGYGILEHFGIDKNYWRQDVVARVFSTLGQPNWLAAYLCILLPISLDELLKSKTKLFAAYYLLLVIIFYICLLFTKSKSGLIAAVISLGIYGLIFFIKNNRRKLLIIIFSFLIILSLLIPGPVKDFFFPTPISNPPLVSDNLNITPSEDIRKIVWQGAFSLWRRFPLIGTGPETFAYSYYWVRPASHNLTSEWNFLYNKAHNEYLNYLATTGTFGFTTYIILILFILFSFRRSVLLTSFISILITNSVGFSVAIISLYFFLLPAFVISPINYQPSSPKSKFFLPFLVLFFLFLESKTLFYFLADITYAQAGLYDSLQKYPEALEQIKLSYGYRPNEPNYLIKYADISAKLAVVTKDQKYISPAVSTANLATVASPFDVNIWKQKAQVYYYLSAVDSQYYSNAVNSLATAAKLASTDAMTFYLLGTFYHSFGDTDNALKYFQQALALKSNYDHAAFAIAQIYFNQKKYPESKDFFQNTLAITPANTDAKNYLAKIATMSAAHK